MKINNQKECINYIDMLEPIRLGYADIIYKDEKQLIFIETRSQALMISMHDISHFKEIYERENLCKYELINVKQKEIVDILVNYGKKYQFSCFQEVYIKNNKIALSEDYRIQLLQRDDISLITKYYKEVDDIEYIQHIVDNQHMWGIFEEEQLAGFIGIHLEGSMGLLEILPNYRRKGYGEALESFLINWYLENDLVPYCQVIEGNEASLKLQKKLGLKKSEILSYWLF
ncbi:MAG: GNAT family N-acetyltransferase [Coprobacillus sp.]